MTFDLNTPRAPSGLERIEGAMRRDTAAPSFRSLAFLWSVSASGAWREMPADPLVELVWSWQILGDPGRSCQFFLAVDKRNVDYNIWYQIDLKWRQKCAESDQNDAKREPKWDKTLSKTPPAEQRRKRCQNVCSVLILWDDHFDVKSFKMQSEIQTEIGPEQTWNICQKVSELEPKSMPKLITNQCQNRYRNKSGK